MTKNSDNHEKTELLSTYIDQLNLGIAPTLDTFAKSHGEAGEYVKYLLEPMWDLKGAMLCDPLPEERKNAIFFRLQEELKSAAPAEQTTSDAVAITQRTDILILLLYLMNEIWGNIKLVKLPFLLAREGNCSNFVSDFYLATADNFGPFDKNILKDVDELYNMGIVEKQTVLPRKKRRADGDLGVPDAKQIDAVYKLTATGKQVAERLKKGALAQNPLILENIKKIVDTYGKKSQDELLTYVYNTYPDTTTKSLIRDKYLKPKKTDSSKEERGGRNE
jgi:hypothetical protein